MNYIKTTLVAIACIFGSHAHAAPLHTIAIDGVNDFSADEALISSSPGTTWYLTWDSLSIYIGVESPTLSARSSNDYMTLYVDASSSGTTTGVTYNTQQPNLPFDADYHISYRSDGGLLSTLQWDGASWTTTSGVITNSAASGSFAEFQLSKSAIGNPGTIDVVGAFVSEASFNEWTFGIIPSTSASDGYDPDFTQSLHYDLTSPVPVPAAIWLFGSGLIGLIGMARKMKS